MFDPMTVVCDIPNIFVRRWTMYGGSKRFHSLITVWHKDPCSDGTDSSCWHKYEHRKMNKYERELEQFIYDGEPIFDNHPHYPDSREHKWFTELKRIKREWSARRDFFRIPWRWHFWHYRFQVHPLQQLKRRLFSRCQGCGGRFAYGQEVVGTSWHSTGPLWFRSESHIYHDQCLPNSGTANGKE